MSQPELLLMSQRERDRLKVVHEVQKGQLSQKQGTAQLGLTDRWARKLLKRLRAEGDRGIVHRLRGGVQRLFGVTDIPVGIHEQKKYFGPFRPLVTSQFKLFDRPLPLIQVKVTGPEQIMSIGGVPSGGNAVAQMRYGRRKLSGLIES